MSLDVYLSACSICQHCGKNSGVKSDEVVFWSNITHNLGEMAEEAGIYQHLWRPEELNITKAEQLIEPLKEGLARLLKDPDRFRKFNPENGWGNYETLLAFVEKYLKACVDNPESIIEISR